jgi:hypothetical protein
MRVQSWKCPTHAYGHADAYVQFEALCGESAATPTTEQHAGSSLTHVYECAYVYVRGEP